jgi:hypothetical protein
MSDFLNSVVPSAPLVPTLFNPRVLVIYGGYKTGKSKLAEFISTHKRGLWLDCEDGSEGCGGVRINILRKVRELNAGKEPREQLGPLAFLLKLCTDLSAEPAPRFDYLVVDKLDNVEEWAERRATAYYKSTIIGRNFTGHSVLELDKGGGYKHLQEEFRKVWNIVVAAAPRVVFLGSLRDRQIDKTDSLMSNNDLDLTGKVRKIAVGFSDTTGYLYREKDGSNWISFQTNDVGTFSGSRIERLSGQRFRLSWHENDPTTGTRRLIVDWNKLFVPEGATK